MSGLGDEATPRQDAARIHLSRPMLVGLEMEYMAQALSSGWIAGDGPFTRKCQRLLEQELGVERVFLTTSCTDALEMAALLLDVGPDDEVIVPAFTFVSTANAFALRGARPVFADVRADTLNLDTAKLESRITRRTKVIVAVHYAGVGCEMDAIGEVARGNRIAVVEDNAHGLFGKYRGKPLGTWGALAAQSFHETKNFTCGEGGALLVNEADRVTRAEIVREKGTNRSRFLRGQVDKYTWVDLGSSYLPAELLAAFLFAQLERREHIQQRRRRIWERYSAALAPLAAAERLRLPGVPADCEQSFHLYYVLLRSQEERDALRRHLARRNIESAFHYVPLHLSDMGRRYGGRHGDCPVAEDAAGRLLRLPFHGMLSDTQQEQVIDAVNDFWGR